MGSNQTVVSRVFKIALYGDSLAMPRKAIVKYHERYIYLIQEWISKNKSPEYIELKDKAKGSVTILDMLEQYEHDSGYFEFPADVLILQSGVVDCAPRPVAQETREKISRMPSFIRKMAIKYLHKNRSKILQKGNAHVRVERELFYNSVKQFLQRALKDYKRIYVINICPTNEKTEQHSPGFTANINEYNALLKKAIEETGSKNVFLVDVNKFINERFKNIDDYILKEDGHHLTPLGNKIIAEEIISKESAYLKN